MLSIKHEAVIFLSTYGAVCNIRNDILALIRTKINFCFVKREGNVCHLNPRDISVVLEVNSLSKMFLITFTFPA